MPAMRAHRPRREDETESVIDRARFGLYPPGSTFKLVTASAALRQNLALRDSTFMCSLQGNGRVGARVDGTVVRDDVLDRDPHGTIDMHDGLVHSCNAYFAQLAVRVGPRSILDTANLLGISVARDDSVARLRSTLPQAGYGQGDVVATPLRMARVAAAIASSGILRDTRVVAGSPASTNTQVLLTPGAATTLGRYLRDSVLSGTGRSLRGHPWRIAGKTGTAEVHDAQSHAWFVGYAPYGAGREASRVCGAHRERRVRRFGGSAGGWRDCQRRRGERIGQVGPVFTGMRVIVVLVRGPGCGVQPPERGPGSGFGPA